MIWSHAVSSEVSFFGELVCFHAACLQSFKDRVQIASQPEKGMTAQILLRIALELGLGTFLPTYGTFLAHTRKHRWTLRKVCLPSLVSSPAKTIARVTKSDPFCYTPSPIPSLPPAPSCTNKPACSQKNQKKELTYQAARWGREARGCRRPRRSQG